MYINISFKRSLKIILPLIGYSIFMLWLLITLSNSGHETASRTGPQINASIEIKYELALYHLWFEEFVSGDELQTKEKVWEHLDKSLWYIRALLDGGQNKQGKLLPVIDHELRTSLYLTE